METLDQAELIENKEIITPKVLSNMNSISPWMLLMGVLFIIMALFMLLAGILVIIGSNAYSSLGLEGAVQLMGAFYLISGTIFGIGGVLLVTSGSKLSTFSKYPNANLLEVFTSKQKQFWMLMGLNALVTIVFFIAFIIMAGKLAKLAGAGM